MRQGSCNSITPLLTQIMLIYALRKLARLITYELQQARTKKGHSTNTLKTHKNKTLNPQHNQTTQSKARPLESRSIPHKHCPKHPRPPVRSLLCYKAIKHFRSRHLTGRILLLRKHHALRVNGYLRRTQRRTLKSPKVSLNQLWMNSKRTARSPLFKLIINRFNNKFIIKYFAKTDLPRTPASIPPLHTPNGAGSLSRPNKEDATKIYSQPYVNRPRPHPANSTELFNDYTTVIPKSPGNTQQKRGSMPDESGNSTKFTTTTHETERPLGGGRVPNKGNGRHIELATWATRPSSIDYFGMTDEQAEFYLHNIRETAQQAGGYLTQEVRDLIASIPSGPLINTPLPLLKAQILNLSDRLACPAHLIYARQY